VEGTPLLERSDGRERTSDQSFPRGSQERGCRQVELSDSGLGIERAVPDRREVVQVRIPRRGLLESLLGLSQLPILDLELYLTDFEIVEESLGICTRMCGEPALVRDRLALAWHALPPSDVL